MVTQNRYCVSKMSDDSRTRLTEFQLLHENWDSYGAPAIDVECINVARSLLELIELASGVVPLVFPTAAGGVQLEWRNQNGTEAEVEIIPTKPGTRMEHLITDASGNVLSDTEMVWEKVRQLKGLT